MGERRADRSFILAVGFGTSVVMWTVGYVCRLPSSVVPSWLVLYIMLGCVWVSGAVVGRFTGWGWRGGVFTGLVTALLNMLILGGLLGSDDPNRLVPSATIWIPGSILLVTVLSFGGALIGGLFPRPSPVKNWIPIFARVAVAATFVLLILGGLVTSHEAGLAVVDWPNSFGYNMFLYPLARMTGGIYYEHAHRLFGSLVGLTTLALAIQLQWVEKRRWLRRLGWTTFILVVLQGILGGLRVTGHFTLSASPEQTAPSMALAVLHGITGQAVFALLVAVAVFTSHSWQGSPAAETRTAALVDRSLSTILVFLVILQLVLGALQRHMTRGLLIHISLGALVAVVAVAAGARAWGLYRNEPIMNRLGQLIAILMVIQVVLGLTALATIGVDRGDPAFAVLIHTSSEGIALATAHQVVGALLLACAVMLTLWARRLAGGVTQSRARHQP